MCCCGVVVGFEIPKAEFERLALEKLDDAELLLANRRWSNAYYLVGYAVELAFKACISKGFRAETFPDKDIVNSAYTHSLGKLAEQAQLKLLLEAERPAVRANWAMTLNWVPESRYKSYVENDASSLFNAVSDPADGVFPWIRVHW